jgi:hypothetical protein
MTLSLFSSVAGFSMVQPLGGGMFSLTVVLSWLFTIALWGGAMFLVHSSWGRREAKRGEIPRFFLFLGWFLSGFVFLMWCVALFLFPGLWVSFPLMISALVFLIFSFVSYRKTFRVA